MPTREPVTATPTRTALAALAALAALLPSGATASAGSRAAASVRQSDGPVLVVWAAGGHFAQDEPELDLALDFSGDLRVPGRIRVYVPAGFELYPARPAGSDVGSARVYAADYSGGATTLSLLEGDITAQPLDPAAETAAQSCSPGPHIGLWRLRLSLLGQPLDLPIYLAARRANDPPGAALKLDLCPPPINTGNTPGPALPIAQISLKLPDLEPPTAHGSYLWRAAVAPLAPDRRTILTDEAFELRSLILVPHRLTLSGRYLGNKHAALLQGTLRALGRPRPGVQISLIKLVRTVVPGGVVIHDALAGTTRTTTTGAYSFRTRIRKTAGFIAIAADTTSPCEGAASAPRGCLNTTIAGIQSDPVTVSVPTR